MGRKVGNVAPGGFEPVSEANISVTYTSHAVNAGSGSLVATSEQVHVDTVVESLHLETSTEDVETAGCSDPNDERQPLGPDKEKRATYTPIPRWLQKRERFLLEMLRLEGRGDYANSPCSLCGKASPIYRCTECLQGELLCQQCVVGAHQRTPLHAIERWTAGHFFERVSLKELGLIIQLGHPLRESCRAPKRPHKGGFTVIDIYGIQEVELRFCDCENALPCFVQLLRYGWYPASVDRPQTAATNSVLKFFQLLNFEAKSSLFEFYNTLSRWSDNTGLLPSKDRYQAFVTMVREYRNLKSLKRGARGHQSNGAAGTRKGELAVLCPACPQPGINMSPGWQHCREEDRFLHRLFLAIDANFRLKRRNVSTEGKDPSLSDGWSYFVPRNEYQTHLTQYEDLIPQPRSTCSNLKAINDARIGKGLAVTGVSAVDCARHDMKRPLAVGDLQKGERQVLVSGYVNTDYVFFTSLQNSDHLEVVVSYDVCCQWSKHIWERMMEYPHSMHIIEDRRPTFRFVIPKFHLPSHIVECQTRYSLNFEPDVGRTDGEALERGWANLNRVALSSSEMGPGNRTDALNDHFGDFNWKKTTAMALSLKTKLEEAVQEYTDFRFLHNQFALGLDKTQVKEWELALLSWGKDKSKPNPYERQFAVITIERVRKHMEEGEKKQKKGPNYVLHEDMSAVQLIATGLNFEERQRQLSRKITKEGSSSQQGTSLHGRMSNLQKDISAWIETQHLYVPELHAVRQRDARAYPSNRPEPPVTALKLYLPSSILAMNRKILCDKRLLLIEIKLRSAQANDALNELRDALRLRSFAYLDKDRFQRGQQQNTRSRGIISRLEDKVKGAAAKYTAARDAIAQLAPMTQTVDWETDFPTLAKGDIRSFVDDDLPPHMKVKLTMKQKKMLLTRTSKKALRANRAPDGVSWIWRRLGAQRTDDKGFQENLRIEFCKSKARADRWREELLLVQQEMYRVKRFFKFRAAAWRRLSQNLTAQRQDVENCDVATKEGLRAYAFQQSDMFSKMYKNCAAVWEGIPQYKYEGGRLRAVTTSDRS